MKSPGLYWLLKVETFRSEYKFSIKWILHHATTTFYFQQVEIKISAQLHVQNVSNLVRSYWGRWHGEKDQVHLKRNESLISLKFEGIETVSRSLWLLTDIGVLVSGSGGSGHIKHDSTGAQTTLAQGDAQWLIMKERFYIVRTASLDITEGLSPATGQCPTEKIGPSTHHHLRCWHHINSINTNSQLNRLDKVGPAVGRKIF